MSVHRYVHPSAAEAAEAAARAILTQLEQAVAANDRATFAISGGNSPKPMFAALAASGFNWSRVEIFFVDERGVPPADPQSNFRMVDEVFFAPAKIAHRHVHRVHTEFEARKAAEKYAAEIRAVFELNGPGTLPHFDVIHLGMGPDAHTASLFPGDPLIEDRQNLAAATHVEKLKQWRVTLLPGVLVSARHTVVFAPGADKAEAVRSVLEGDFEPLQFPAQIPAHLGRGVSWFMDEAAARLLT